MKITDLVKGSKTSTFKLGVTSCALSGGAGSSDDILLYSDIRHCDLNMLYTHLMSHHLFHTSEFLEMKNNKHFRTQCTLMTYSI